MTVQFTNGLKITGSQDAINYLLCIFQEAAESYGNGNYEAISEQCMENTHIMFEALDKSGYYDEIRRELNL